MHNMLPTREQVLAMVVEDDAPPSTAEGSTAD